MALEVGQQEVGTLTCRERTTRIDIRTPVGKDPIIRVMREKAFFAADGSLAYVDGGSSFLEIRRNLSKVVAQTFTLGDVTLTGAQLAGFLALAGDTWSRENVVNANVLREAAAAAQIERQASRAAAIAAVEEADRASAATE